MAAEIPVRLAVCVTAGCVVAGHGQSAYSNPYAPAEYRLPHNARCDDFFGLKRTQLKRTAEASASEKQNMEATHADSSTLVVQVQGADRHGDGSR